MAFLAKSDIHICIYRISQQIRGPSSSETCSKTWILPQGCLRWMVPLGCSTLPCLEHAVIRREASPSPHVAEINGHRRARHKRRTPHGLLKLLSFQISIWWRFPNPSEKYAQIKLDHATPRIGVKRIKYLKPPPPSPSKQT